MLQETKNVTKNTSKEKEDVRIIEIPWEQVTQNLSGVPFLEQSMVGRRGRDTSRYISSTWPYIRGGQKLIDVGWKQLLIGVGETYLIFRETG